MRLAGHPLHPMLVHFPIAFWTSAFGADICGLFFNALPFAALAFGASALGCLLGLIAMLAGIVDFTALPEDSPARDTAVTHMMLMCGAWLLFLVGLALRGYPPTDPAPLGAIIVSALGFAIMAAGGWLGGRLVYEFGVGRKRPD
ncbi:MAG TPA: DUF2231 domain-containing protein [Steroidobacteraceae bacterium]|jgi:uncharacterized membrane protein|nr:DUF2231 domain-containing protein [Steroidobacteraceae bacterium]